MGWYKLGAGLSDKYKNIQGCINAKIAGLYEKGDMEAVKAYADTLTENQRKQARSHLKTELQRRPTDDKRNNHYTD